MNRTPRVYLDWNATTPPLPAVLEAMMRAASDAWANPSSVHADGRRARARVEAAREALAALAHVDPRDVVLTGGGTEANNLALRSAFANVPRAEGRPPSLVVSRLEHPSVTRVAEALEREGRARVRWLRVTPEGAVDLDDLAAALRAEPVALVAVQAANAETGVVQPTHEAAALAREHGALLHVDAVQAWGKVSLNESDGDTRAFAAHKTRGPKGIGALFTRPSAHLEPCLVGGAQERGVRPGTIDPVAAAGLEVAAKHAAAGAERYAKLAILRDKLESLVRDAHPGAVVNGAGPRVPHVTNLAFPGRAGPELVAALDLEGVSVSSGSACSAGTNEPSPVLTAMSGPARAASSVRISLGETTTDDDVERAVEAFRVVLRRGSPRH
jgi:cysteine desulfurase